MLCIGLSHRTLSDPSLWRQNANPSFLQLQPGARLLVPASPTCSLHLSLIYINSRQDLICTWIISYNWFFFSFFICDKVIISLGWWTRYWYLSGSWKWIWYDILCYRAFFYDAYNITSACHLLFFDLFCLVFL